VLLFVGALPQEFTGLLKRCTAVRTERLPVHWARSGLLQNRPILAIANGVGARQAYAAVAGPDLELVCNIGFCGALDPALRIADIVVATHVNGEEIRVPHASNAAIRGPLASIDHVAQSAVEKAALRSTGAIAVEMEAAGALKRTQALGVPFYSVRAVSDLAEETLRSNFNRALREDGRVRTSELAFQALMHPFTCLPELIRLGRRSAFASERLGEFLAACEF
jgi:nucleoside phosphorylase